jgi:hypothetical protein
VRRRGRQRLRVDALLAGAARRHGAEFVAGTDGAVIDADPDLLERALAEFCTAAWGAGARHVRFAAQRHAGSVAVHCEHDGAGAFVPGKAMTVALAVHDGRLRCTRLARGLRRTLLLPAVRPVGVQA